jgi:hypothetical protein
MLCANQRVLDECISGARADARAEAVKLRDHLLRLDRVDERPTGEEEEEASRAVHAEAALDAKDRELAKLQMALRQRLRERGEEPPAELGETTSSWMGGSFSSSLPGGAEEDQQTGEGGGASPTSVAPKGSPSRGGVHPNGGSKARGTPFRDQSVPGTFEPRRPKTPPDKKLERVLAAREDAIRREAAAIDGAAPSLPDDVLARLVEDVDDDSVDGDDDRGAAGSDPFGARISFSAYDADGSGSIDPGELASLLSDSLGVDDEQCEAYANAIIVSLNRKHGGHTPAIDWPTFRRFHRRCVNMGLTYQGNAPSLVPSRRSRGK